MPRANTAIENICRVCHATAPKASLKKIQSFQANWFLIPYNFKECICSSCQQKYENYKNSTFAEVCRKEIVEQDLIDGFIYL